MPEITLRYTEEHFLQSHRRYRSQMPGYETRRIARVVVLGAAPLLIAIFVVLSLTVGPLDECLFVTIGIIGLAAFAVLFSESIADWLLSRSFRQSPYRDELLRVDFREDGFQAKGEVANVSYTWTAFTKVVHFRDGFLLFQGPRVFNWIPVRYFEDAVAVAEAEAILRDNIAQHKVIEPVRWQADWR